MTIQELIDCLNEAGMVLGPDAQVNILNLGRVGVCKSLIVEDETVYLHVDFTEEKS